MDNRRLILTMALMLVLLLIWQEWQVAHAPQPQSVESSEFTAGGETEPQLAQAPGDVPDFQPDQSMPSAAALPDSDAAAVGQAELIKVTTDLFHAGILTRGAELVRLELLEYPIHKTEPDNPFVLLNKGDRINFTAQGGLISQQAAPNHHAVFTASSNNYEMKPGQDSLEVVLEWTSPEGIRVDKVLRFNRGSYVIEQSYRIHNDSDSSWNGRIYSQLQRDTAYQTNLKMIPTYTGTAVSSQEKRYEKLDFDDLQDAALDRDVSNGWLAEIQHYFVVALLPHADKTYHYYSKILDNTRYSVGVYGPAVEVPAGSSTELNLSMYAGPKVQDTLKDLAPGLELTVDYGKLWFISKPLFWLLDYFHTFTGNWGWSIVLVTVAIKLLFFKLSAASYRSMANMRRVTPKMTALRERFSDDRQKLNQAMMDLYKKEKINPLGGCLPILIQIPVFLALYWVLLESVELRQAPFILWINDLSDKDPYFVLPVLMGISMFAQQKLNPAPPDPLQAKIMMALPFVFTIMFATFPAGLVLYWFVNNVLSIAQQYVITRKVESEGKPA